MDLKGRHYSSFRFDISLKQHLTILIRKWKKKMNNSMVFRFGEEFLSHVYNNCLLLKRKRLVFHKDELYSLWWKIGNYTLKGLEHLYYWSSLLDPLFYSCPLSFWSFSHYYMVSKVMTNTNSEPKLFSAKPSLASVAININENCSVGDDWLSELYRLS